MTGGQVFLVFLLTVLLGYGFLKFGNWVLKVILLIATIGGIAILLSSWDTINSAWFGWLTQLAVIVGGVLMARDSKRSGPNRPIGVVLIILGVGALFLTFGATQWESLGWFGSLLESGLDVLRGLFDTITDAAT